MTQDETLLRLPKAIAEDHMARLFELAGAAPDIARAVALALVEAELEGSPSHGLLQAPVYIRRLLAGTISGTARLKEVHRSGAISVHDAGLALGHAAAGELAAIAVRDALEFGMAAAAVRSGIHFGVAGRYARSMAERGMLGIVMCNTTAMMPPPGGRRPVVGNNPLAIAVPCAGQPPIVFDMAMSAAAMGRIRQAAEQGQPIPAGWAADRDGNDTTDPRVALAGFLLPAAGAKGFGLALMVDLLCALAGGSCGTELRRLHGPVNEKADCSWLFLALDPNRFGLATGYAERVAELASEVRGAAPDPSRALPGDRRRAAVAGSGDEIRLPASIAASLEALSIELGAGPLPRAAS